VLDVCVSVNVGFPRFVDSRGVTEKGFHVILFEDHGEELNCLKNASTGAFFGLICARSACLGGGHL